MKQEDIMKVEESFPISDKVLFYVYYFSSCADGHKGLPADVQAAVPSEI